MKVYLILDQAHDETVVNEVFANKDKDEAYAKKKQSEADQYTTFYVEEWDVKE